MYTKFWWENLKLTDHLEDLGAGMPVILQEIRWEVWIDLAHDRKRWRDIANTAIKLRVP
jgi:hypothetical protein